MTTLTSLDYTLNLIPEQGVFSILPHDERFPGIEDVRLEVVARHAGRVRHLLTDAWKVVETQFFAQTDSPHGNLQGVVLSLRPSESGLRVQLIFALLPEQPLVLWKIKLTNLSDSPTLVERLELLQAAPAAWLDSPDPAFFCNGWQSWAYTGVFGAGQAIPRTRLGIIRGPMNNNATPQHHRVGDYSSDFFGVLGDRQERRGLLLGLLSERQHFGSLEAVFGRPALRLWANGDRARLDPGKTMETDWAAMYFFNLDTPDPLRPYLDAVVRENGIVLSEKHAQAPAGWCSWYHFYQNLSATQVEDNLSALLKMQDRLPVSLVQIDDGFEKQVGDWFTFSRGFPRGVAGLAEKIRGSGMTPGLWLAPFIVHTGAEVFRQHPEWILRGRFNRPVNAGFVWNNFTTALDLTNPEALEHACQVVKTAAQEWGFPYLKLDFLYAGSLPGKHMDPTRTRAQILRAGLEALRQAVGAEVFLLGCGAPFGPALGIFDAMRIGADTAGDWKTTYNGIELFFEHEPDMPSARNSIQNILTRANLHRRWWINDPDCLLLRQETHLTLAEIQSFASAIALTGGLLLVSDDLPRLPVERLRIAEVLLPTLPGRAEVLDWFDATTPQRLRLDVHASLGDWHLLAYFNWSDHLQTAQVDLSDYRLPPGEYWARSFWDGKTWHWDGNHGLKFENIPPHGGVVLAVRQALAPEIAQYLGGDLHISQGVEVREWQVTPQQVRLIMELPRRVAGEVELLLPEPPAQATINGETCSWRALGERRYAFNLSFDQHGELQITY